MAETRSNHVHSGTSKNVVTAATGNVTSATSTIEPMRLTLEEPQFNLGGFLQQRFLLAENRLLS